MEALHHLHNNSSPLLPVSFLERAALVYGDKVSIVYGTVSFTWRETHQRCLRLASGLTQLGISPGDTVAAMAPNIPALYDLHFAVPMAGAVLSALNTKLDAAKHDQGPDLVSVGGNKIKYDDLIAMGETDFEIVKPKDEGDPISVNFTSGSTGEPKGVLYSHKAAYLKSLASVRLYDMGVAPVFLWTVDMFRCNGWCCTWTMAAVGGTNICLRTVSAKFIFDSIVLHNVTHLCGGPAILNLIADASLTVPFKVRLIVAGVLPMSRVMKVEGLGYTVSHAYGMTEEPETMASVRHDGKTIGEVMFKGNTLMLGYLKDPKATEEAFKDGWYRTKDLGVIHPNGVIQLKDRAKDIIFTGGEIVSTLEVEAVLLSHPKVSEAAVVGKRDDYSKETPCAFVKFKEEYYYGAMSCQEIVEFCEERLPDFMVPRTVVFGELPVNSTGKVQKFTLRVKANGMHSNIESAC
ncbi:hypothetical protein GOBAR_DD26973 [Gossypium barbadense]|nr:hypothetical protein GOBAR_DD26973 [Gossypium barbadense]